MTLPFAAEVPLYVVGPKLKFKWSFAKCADLLVLRHTRLLGKRRGFSLRKCHVKHCELFLPLMLMKFTTGHGRCTYFVLNGTVMKTFSSAIATTTAISGQPTLMKAPAPVPGVILVLSLIAISTSQSCMGLTTTLKPGRIAEISNTDLQSDGTKARFENVVGENGGADVDSNSDEEAEKFIWPLLSDYVGAGNQLMEYMSAAVVARALNRTLCLTPFHGGPVKHILGNGGQKGQRLGLEDRYDEETLAKFVKVASLDHCLKSCNHELDDTWFLRGQRPTHLWHFNHNVTDKIWKEGKDLQWSFVSWTSTMDVCRQFGDSNLKCVALGGLFPGLRWRGAYLAVAAYLVASNSIAHSASSIQSRLIGANTRYLAVHWRFEESFCGGQQLGSCFFRCNDGAIVNTGLHPQATEWIEHTHKRCSFHGVRVTKEDVVGAIYDRAVANNISTVYLATDGWMRSKESAWLVKDVVEMLRAKNMTIVGLWRIEGLPNFPNGDYLPDLEDPKMAELFGIQGNESNHMDVNSRLIAGSEQEICSRADVFLGSGQSTWSLAVYRSRLARRRALAIMKSLKKDASNGMSNEDMLQADQSIHDQIIPKLLQDKHEAGVICGYHRFYDKVPMNATKETFEDEIPDGWLDLEACEMRIGHKGGKCEFATCS